jgi:hypothetical protein
MATWKYEVETKDGFIETLIVHVKDGRALVTMCVWQVPIQKGVPCAACS